MPEPGPHPEAEALIQGYLEGDLRPAEARRLQELLRQDPSLARLILESLRDDSQLREWTRRRTGMLHSSSPSGKPSREESPGRNAVQPAAKTRREAKSPGRLRAVTTLMALLVALFILGVFLGRAPAPRVLRYSNAAGIELMRGGRLLPLASGMALKPGDRFSLGPESDLILAFVREDTEFTLEPGSQVTLKSWRTGKQLELNRGRVMARVAPQGARHPMVIDTPDASALIMGTEFGLAATAEGTALDVWSGRVRLTRQADGASVEVPAGQSAAMSGTSLGLLPARVTYPPGMIGSIEHEYWLYLPGRALTNLTRHPAFPREPSGRERIATLVLPADWGVFSGGRIRGWLYPPETGEYTFWITADDTAELRLGVDASPAGVRKIAEVTEATKPGEWEQQAGQRSVPVLLKSGHRYYLEVLHKQAAAPGGLAVAWAPPDGRREVISGEVLSPFRPPGQTAATPELREGP